MCNNGDIAIMLYSCGKEILPYCLITVPVKICTYFILIPNKNTLYAVRSRPLHPYVATWGPGRASHRARRAAGAEVNAIGREGGRAREAAVGREGRVRRPLVVRRLLGGPRPSLLPGPLPRLPLGVRRPPGASPP